MTRLPLPRPDPLAANRRLEIEWLCHPAIIVLVFVIGFGAKFMLS